MACSFFIVLHVNSNSYSIDLSSIYFKKNSIEDIRRILDKKKVMTFSDHDRLVLLYELVIKCINTKGTKIKKNMLEFILEITTKGMVRTIKAQHGSGF